MGRATLAAYNSVLSLEVDKQLQGSVLVKDPGRNTYVEHTQKQLASSGNHIEESLFNKLKSHYGNNPNSIPNNSTIIFFCGWSPCRQCTCDLVPGIVQWLKLPNRGIIVKSRFISYYTKQEVATMMKGSFGGKDELLWPNEEHAKLAHTPASTTSGVGRTKDTADPESAARGGSDRLMEQHYCVSFGLAYEKTAPAFTMKTRIS